MHSVEKNFAMKPCFVTLSLELLAELQRREGLRPEQHSDCDSLTGGGAELEYAADSGGTETLPLKNVLETPEDL